MQRLSTLTNVLETQQKADALVALAVSRDGRWSADPIEAFVHRGHGRFVGFAKAAVDAILSSDAGVALAPLATAFVGMVERESLAGRLEGAVRIPLDAAARIQIATVIGQTVTEGAAKPISRMDFTFAGQAQKVAATIVASAEFFRSVDPVSQEMLRRQLVSAVAAAYDAALVAALTSGAATAGSGVGDLLAVISGGAPARPVVIGAFDSLIPIADDLVALRALGVTVLVSAAASGRLIAVDAGGILLAEDPVRVETARHADIEMSDAPSGGPRTGLWQTNTAALRAEQYVRIAVRPDSVAWMETGTP